MYRANVIFYVEDLQRSHQFYENIFSMWPTQDEPSYREFVLSDGVVLGLLSTESRDKLFKDTSENGSRPHIAHAELYLHVWYPESCLIRAESAGGKILSLVQKRDWGDEVGYAADPDGNILAFAKKTEEESD